MAEIAGVDISGVSQHGRQRLRQFHRVKLSSSVTVL